jgi:peptidyl-prolyl cis-trans isomerase A (cyclophilin A)
MSYLFLAVLAAGALCLLPMAGAASAADKDHPVVVLETSMGSITIELDRAKAPITVDNFLKYVDDGFYNNTIFHRVIPNFMIQGGGMTQDLREKKTTYPSIKNESTNGLKNKRGTIAMARTSVPDSASSQFFINLKDNEFLDRANAADGVGYAVFGKVTEGMDVVDKIAKVQTVRKGPHEAVPVEPVIIKSAKRKAS